jgi:hypothetical protein
MEVFDDVEPDPGWGAAGIVDPVLARNLARVVNVPEKHVVSYLKSRNRSDTAKLQSVLQELPGTDWSGASLPGHSARRAKQKTPRATSAETPKPFAQISPNSTMFQTSYESCFSPHGKYAGKTPDVAFEGLVRNEYKDCVRQWRERANEDQVRVLADTCRSLRWVSAQYAGSSTEHANKFIQHADEAHNTPSARVNARNVSRVPLGSIYAHTDDACYLDRQNTLIKKVNDLHQQQLSMTQGSFGITGKTAVGACIYADASKEAGCAGCMDEGMSSNNWKSESRAAWHGELHSKKQALKHSNKRFARGFCARESAFQTKDILVARGERHFQIPPLPQPGPEVLNGLLHEKNTFNTSRRFFP